MTPASAAASVIVPVRNGAEFLAGQLHALSRQTCHSDWEVVIADNGSTDHTVEVALATRDALPSLRVIDASIRPGVSYARNAGAAAARGEMLMFCDADDEVDPGWLQAMIRAGERFDVWGGGLDRERFTPPLRIRPGLGRSTDLISWPGHLPFCSGASFGVQRQVFTALEGFDESFISGGDDTDFCWRASYRGYSVGFADGALVYYRERETSWDAARQFYRYGVQDPHLYRRHASHGMDRPSAATVASTWLGLTVGGVRFLRTPALRAQWTRSAARRAGRVAGSLRYRTLYL